MRLSELFTACAASLVSGAVLSGTPADIESAVSDFGSLGYAEIRLAGSVPSTADPGSARLEVTRAENRSEAVMPGWEAKTSGLSWGEPARADGSAVPAFTPALAAGWPGDRGRWWLGGAVMPGRAMHVDIRDGNPHGSGGADPAAGAWGVCLKPARAE